MQRFRRRRCPRILSFLYQQNSRKLQILRRGRLRVILAGKRDSRRHSATSFNKNVVVAGTSYQM